MTVEKRLSANELEIIALKGQIKAWEESRVDFSVKHGQLEVHIDSLKKQVETNTREQKDNMAEIRKELKDDIARLERFLDTATKELTRGQDVLINALGLNDDPNAAKNLKKNLNILFENNADRAQSVRHIKNVMLGGLALGVLALLSKFGNFVLKGF